MEHVRIPDTFQWSMWMTAHRALERFTGRSQCRASQLCRPAPGPGAALLDLLMLAWVHTPSTQSSTPFHNVLGFSFTSFMNIKLIFISLYSNQVSLALCLPSHSHGKPNSCVVTILEKPKLGVKINPVIMISIPLSFWWSEENINRHQFYIPS